MDWSPKQQQALDTVAKWLDSGDSPFFYLAGYAGTGKTTLAKHLAEGVKGETLFAAYTGKAALCMQKSGVPQARTIHSILYRPVPTDTKRIAELEKLAMEEGFTAEVIGELTKLKAPQFEINPESPILEAGLLVLDECSMINEEMAQDILSFGVPILVLGDPMQLPPVKGTGYFTNRTPDTILTEIHRQAADNPIIALSKHVREHGNVPVNFAENAGRVSRGRAEEFIDGRYQFLTGKNVTRTALNQRLRIRYGYEGTYPQPGETLICLRNSKDRQLYNGMFATVDEATPPEDNFLLPLDITTELGTAYEDVPVLSTYFSNEIPFDQVPFYIVKEREQFDYGYCITVHKAQGSQFENVVLYDDGFLNWKREERQRWLYTAVTRAVDSVFVI